MDPSLFPAAIHGTRDLTDSVLRTDGSHSQAVRRKEAVCSARVVPRHGHGGCAAAHLGLGRAPHQRRSETEHLQRAPDSITNRQTSRMVPQNR